MEIVLLLLFLGGQWVHLHGQSGQVSGFDAGDFFFRVGQMSAGVANPDLKASFWAYHPPLAFFLAANVERAFAVDDARAVQLVSQGASLVAFFAVRETLRHLGLLAHLRGIAFLYLAFALPLVVHATVSANMDILILAASAIVWWGAVALWGRASVGPGTRCLGAVALVGAIVAALLVKFSGLLLAVLPALVAASARAGRARLRAVGAALALAAVALSLTGPYYYARYYQATGQFFPNVNEWWYRDDLRAARAKRDADRGAFLGELFGPRTVAPGTVEPARDRAHTRLEDAWRDLWFKDPLLGETTKAAVTVGRLWAWLFGLGALAGSFALVRRCVCPTWGRLGAVLLPYGALQLVALIAFVYQQPLVEHLSAKGIYVLPLVWTLAYLVASAIPDKIPRPAVWLGLCTLAAITLIGAIVPVY